jgi:Zn-finger nucleic acid-binding protein
MFAIIAPMSVCARCGATIEFRDQDSIRCPYCHAENQAPPKEVQVAVPVQVIYNVVNVPAESLAKSEAARCPHCEVALVTARVHEIDLAGCIDCGGIWVDNASAAHLIAAPQRVFIDLADRASANAKGKPQRQLHPRCPACQAPMQQVDSHRIPLDICPAHGTWFDSHELAALLHALLGDAPSAPAKPANVHCVTCRTMLERSRANFGADGPMCDGCWRDEREKMIAREESGEAHVVAGMLVRGVLTILES